MIATWPDDVGEIIRQRRIDLGLTQEGLAERAGVTRQLLSRLERANADVSLSKVLAILRELRLSVDLRPQPDTDFRRAASTPSVELVTMTGQGAAPRLSEEGLAQIKAVMSKGVSVLRLADSRIVSPESSPAPAREASDDADPIS